MEARKPHLQLIKRGKLKEVNLEEFVNSHLVQGASYSVLSILGPQSSGKSTLLNQLFGTCFEEMDGSTAITKTTEGISIAAAPSEKLIIMDVEGNDSGEREDNLKFEKQLAAFAFGISRIVLVNVAQNSLGRQVGGCKDLLETALEFMVCYLSYHKFTMMVIVRDRDPNTPKDVREKRVFKTIEEVWKKINKPESIQDKRASEVFDVQVVTMLDFRYHPTPFKEEVSELRKKIKDILEGGEGTPMHVSNEFSSTVKPLWGKITESEQLNITSYKESVAYQRCDKVKQELISMFETDMNNVKAVLANKPIEDFASKIEEAKLQHLKSYDEKTKYSVQSIISVKRGELERELLKCAEEAFKLSIKHLHPQIIQLFQADIEKESESASKHPKDIVEGGITESVRQYHDNCRAMVVSGANWNIAVLDDSLEKDLRRKAKQVLDEVAARKLKSVVKRSCIITATGVVAVAGTAATAGGVAIAAGAGVAASGIAAAVAGGAAAASSVATAGVTATAGPAARVDPAGAADATCGIGPQTMVSRWVEGVRTLTRDNKFRIECGTYNPEEPETDVSVNGHGEGGTDEI